MKIPSLALDIPWLSRISMGMRTLGILPVVAAAICHQAHAQDGAPKLSIEQIERFLEESDINVDGLAGKFLGNRDTNRLFYFPTRDQPATPANWGFKFEDIDFNSSDGTKLHGWFMPARGGQPKGTVVFSHGNAGSIGHHLGFVLWLVEARYQVFMYDYRGFGKSGGETDRQGMVEDVKAAFGYVSGRKDVDTTKLVSLGHSLGGAKSLAAISEQPVKGLRAIVIDGTFASYQAMARLVGGDLGAKLINDDFSPRTCIGKITETPLLVVHGDQDQVVPIAQGKELFELANEPKTLFEVKGGSHGNSLARDQGAYRKRMLAWLDEVM